MNPRNWLRFYLVLISLLSLAATPPPRARETNVLHRGSQGGEFPRLLKVPPLRQYRSTSCGEAALTMAYSYANPDAPITEQDAISFATSQGYYTPYRWPFTSPAHMVEMALHYTPVIRTGTVATRDEGLALLADQLREGEPVIIDVPLHLSHPDSVAHFIVVTGISRDAANGIVIHYNDPYTGQQETAKWDGQEGIWNGWQNNNDTGGSGWWLAVPPP